MLDFLWTWRAEPTLCEKLRRGLGTVNRLKKIRIKEMAPRGPHQATDLSRHQKVP